MGERDPQRADFAALEGGGQRTGPDRGLVALLQEGVHALSELGQSGWSFPSEQIAAKLSLQLLDRPCQRRLRHVAFVGGTREVERSRNREEIPDLMHFHDRTLPLIRLAI